MTERSYPVRFTRLMLGIFLCAVSIVLSVQGNIGVSPWDVLHQGLTHVTSLTLGTANIVVGMGILALSVLMGETIGWGTVLNTCTMGLMVDALMYFHVIPQAPNMLVGLLMVLLSLIVLGFGCYFYIGAGMGSGPRDSMMSALSRKFPKVPVGPIRSGLECIAILLGGKLGGQAGGGTLLAMFGGGFVMQILFGLLHFDLKSVKHESLIFTTRRIFSGGEKAVATTAPVEK